jgi:hypothetical protein
MKSMRVKCSELIHSLGKQRRHCNQKQSSERISLACPTTMVPTRDSASHKLTRPSSATDGICRSTAQSSHQPESPPVAAASPLSFSTVRTESP